MKWFALILLALLLVVGMAACDNSETPVNIGTQSSGEKLITLPKETAVFATYAGNWSNNVLSEAYYALNRYRTGSSTCVYSGMAMSDWYYVQSDPSALSVVTTKIGAGNRGGIDGTWNGCCHRGGGCKFFVDLVLYRSSYGIGGGYHLILPGGTYDYRPHMQSYDVHQAQPGWVVQRISPPHSAIVAANLGWGLDLIDSNWTGGDGNFVISRHAMSWAQLGGFTAYRATYMERF